MAQCVAETRALTSTAEAMRAALEEGDTDRLRQLVEAQETGIWRLGRLMKGEQVAGAESPEDLDAVLAAAEAGADDACLRACLAREMEGLARVSRQNAVLLKDGLSMVRGLIAILTGRYDDYGGRALGRASAFSRRA